MSLCFFFFNDTATTEIYTLSLHDALPISEGARASKSAPPATSPRGVGTQPVLLDEERVFRLQNLNRRVDRKSTRLNSSHANISYAVFCLKKKQTRKLMT